MIMALGNEPVTASSRGSTLITAFITLQIFGWIGCSILLLTVVCSRKIQRHATWINFCLTWVLSGVSYSLLFLGHQLKDQPNYPLCLTQAALIYASPPLTAGATAALAMHLLFNVRSSVYAFPQTSAQFHISVMLVISPYITYIGVLIWILVTGLQNPDLVIRVDSGMYCGVSLLSPGRFSAAFVALTMLATVSIEGFIITALYRNGRAYKHDNRDLLAMIIRVLGFSFFSAVAIPISLVFLFHLGSASVPNVIAALHPVAFFFVFGTQKDLLYTWMFWRQQPQHDRLC